MRKLISFVILCLMTMTLLADNKLVSINHDDFEKLKKSQPELQLLDVRSSQEYKEGYIAGAINIDHTEIDAIRATIKQDKPVLLYCRSGRRAGIVAEQLLASGYTKVFHLDGDMLGWLEAKKPVVKEP